MSLSRAIACLRLTRALSTRSCFPAVRHLALSCQSAGAQTFRGRHPAQCNRWSSSARRDGSLWLSLGIEAGLAGKIESGYPHASEPTEAQQALLVALRRLDRRDILLRDAMGRGKTFAVALASVQLALQGEMVMVLVPSVHLAGQVSSLLAALTLTHLDSHQSIVVTTPQAALKNERTLAAKYSTIMIDEPEAMLAPLPPRHLPPPDQKSHPFHRHPPPLATLLDRLMTQKNGDRTRTVWVGAEVNGLLKRIIRQRGWVKRDALELDFGSRPTPRSNADIEEVLGHRSAVQHRPRTVDHTGLLVNAAAGHAIPFDNKSVAEESAMPPPRSGRPEIDQATIAALVSYESKFPPETRPPVALILPPEGYPLDLLAARINEAAATEFTNGSEPMTCSTLGPKARSTGTRMTVVSRSSVPGLDIPTLRRIYLIDGLDLAGLSPAQRARGGLKRRLGFYDIVTGRLGRLGSITAESGGEVISLVVEGSGEEAGLGHVLAKGSSLKTHAAPEHSTEGEQ